MLINEVSKITGLTKKAIEYYTLHGLISPKVLENGYRDFDENDIDRLNKISVLRKLGISIDEIKTVLSDKSGNSLKVISVQKELSIQREQAKKSILDKLSNGMSFSEAYEELKAIDENSTIAEKLLEAFPGYYGRFLSLHFARFLNEPIKTEKQRSAYERIIYFLDNVPSLTFPDDLQQFFDEATEYFGTEQIVDMIDNNAKLIEDPDRYLSENKEILDKYLEFRQSEEYKNSPAYRIMELTKEFNSTSGYNDVFIPAMIELSSSYAEYHKRLEEANEKFLAQYPEIRKML
ncbi:MAG TPA: MerR family transcriptional regulator [Clostridiaceae bacterium]|nr:MerR family transcriptional regulator [Clostridiaceae bacterium]